MGDTDYEIATLHRGKYMLILLVGLCVVTVIIAQIPIQEVQKIIIVLLSLPLLIFLGTKWSAKPSRWNLNNGRLSIYFQNKPQEIDIENIRYIRNVPRSGGNLIMIFLKDAKQPKRYWRNKLFQSADDLEALMHALKMEG